MAHPVSQSMEVTPPPPPRHVRFSVKLFACAKFGYRTVFDFSNTKLEKLPIVKILKLEISVFGLFCLFCQYMRIQFFSK